VEDVPEAAWRATIDGNLTVTFLTLKSFIPGMKARGLGSIVTIASSAGRRADARAPVPYGAAKAGIVMLTQDVAAQAGPFGIRANCIAPETILTENNLQRIPTDLQQTMADRHPIRRLGMPEDVARAALFLISERSEWITGAVLDITGGAIIV
jgi:3-oxoacyl-[acyl-carrier protein] reductase